MKKSQKKSDQQSKSGLSLPTIEKKTVSHVDQTVSHVDHSESVMDLEELQEQYPTYRKYKAIQELE